MKQSTETENVLLVIPKFFDLDNHLISIDSIISIDKNEHKLYTKELYNNSSISYKLTSETMANIISFLTDTGNIKKV